MIRSYNDTQVEAFKRINAQTLDTLFLNELKDDMKIAPFIAKGILNTVHDHFGFKENKVSDNMLPGKVKILAVDAKEPAGKKISDCKMKTIVITMFSEEDQEIRANWKDWKQMHKEQLGDEKLITTILRRYRLLRIISEAHEQGANLTQEKLAYDIFGCGLKTIQRDMKALGANGIILPTRGQQKDIGRGTTHKGQAIKWFLNGKETQEIARRMYHTINSIERYIKAFTKVTFLVEEDYKLAEISFLTGLSYGLCEEYKTIYEQAKTEGKTNLLIDLVKKYNDSNFSVLKKKGGANDN